MTQPSQYGRGVGIDLIGYHRRADGMRGPGGYSSETDDIRHLWGDLWMPVDDKLIKPVA
ncbi:hypothetical protein IG631_16013 [Alternaria alternata]|nr:hypothetical protein IG631_16013 [Alternaria alternata]